MPVPRLSDIEPTVTADELIGALVPPPRFAAVRFSTYRADAAEPSQAGALARLEQLAEQIAGDGVRRRGLFGRNKARPPAQAVYLDGGFGVGKTHLLASLWHAVPAQAGRSGAVPAVATKKAYGTFVEYTNLVGALGFGETVRRLAGHRLVAVDEFELDDPGDTMLMSRFMSELAEAGVNLAATSNTLPDKLGEGRFAADEFRREIRALSARFATVRVDGPDFRHSGRAVAPSPRSDGQVVRSAEATPGSTLDGFENLTARLAELHPSRYGRLVEATGVVHITGVRPLVDQSAALRWVVLIDRLYDRTVAVRASGVPLDRLFPADMLAGGYRKKYLRATSRLLALAREGAAG